mmetsp:Transcript_4971/g.9175  ORF Transcript_4971/g.9175 Transcript_4971/m.9175 type:complete len:215 (-) Transcript_4971:12-656(-)
MSVEPYDFTGKPPLRSRSGGPGVRSGSEGVHRLPANAVLDVHHLRTYELAESPGACVVPCLDVVVVGSAEALGHVTTHGDTRHTLDTSGNDNILSAAHDGLSSKVQCLLRTTALPVNSGAGNSLRKLTRQNALSSQIEGVLPRLAHTTEDNIIDQGRVKGGHLVDQAVEQGRPESHWVHISQSSLVSARSCAGSLNNIRSFRHLRAYFLLKRKW